MCFTERTLVVVGAYELLNDTVFTTIADARAATLIWRKDYNHLRPHSSLSYQPPSQYREMWDK